MQMWLPLIKRDIPGFDGGIYGDKPTVPDDVIEDGERLAAVIEEFRDAAGNPLAYQKAALDGLGPAVQAAVKAFAEMRQRAASLQEDLVALRRTLMAVAGRQDKDYQKLRAERAAYPDDDDDANAPAPPHPVVAAPPGAGPQPLA